MSDKPSAAWYLAPIFLGIIGSGIMWYVLKDENHPAAPKMVKKGWIIGIVLTVIDFAWIPMLLIPFVFLAGIDQQQTMQPISEPIQQKVPAPGFEDVPEMIVESENYCDSSYPDVCIPPWPPDLDCGEIQFTNFKVLPDDPHRFDGDKDGIGCESGSTQSSTTVQPQSKNCSGSARCFTGSVTQIIDGDTIKVGGESIRFALTSTPELHEFGGLEARNFIANICPVGSQALVDEDDGQTEGSYGRIIGVIYCNSMNLNEEILDANLGYLSSGFCYKSEFSTNSWAKKYGCSNDEPTKTTTPSTQTQQPSCDPSYPDFCIPSPPPDLDCKDIPQKRFTVLQPDPHRFDGDKDGIGCES